MFYGFINSFCVSACYRDTIADDDLPLHARAEMAEGEVSQQRSDNSYTGHRFNIAPIPVYFLCANEENWRQSSGERDNCGAQLHLRREIRNNALDNVTVGACM